MATKKKRSAPKPVWERGYLGHVYWLGKTKLGKVRLAGKRSYRWEAGGKAGQSDALERAKRAVELAVAMADKQLDLFSE